MRIFRGDLFTADLSSVVGSEQEGVRPVLIIQNDIGNRYSPTTIVAPVTSKNKTHLPTHVDVTARCLKKDSIILLEQIQTVDKTRLLKYLGRVDKHVMKHVDEAIQKSLGLAKVEKQLKSSSRRRSRHW